MSCGRDSLSANLCSASYKSTAFCRFSQYCAVVPSTAAILAAVSAVIEARPFTIALICLRDTPTASANLAIETSWGARYSSTKISPGRVGRLVLLRIIVMSHHLGAASFDRSVIVLEIHIENVALVAAFEAEREPPIPAYRHSEPSSSISAQSVKSASPAQIADAGCAIYCVKNQAHALMKLGPYPPRPSPIKDLFRPLLANDLIDIGCSNGRAARASRSPTEPQPAWLRHLTGDGTWIVCQVSSAADLPVMMAIPPGRQPPGDTVILGGVPRDRPCGPPDQRRSPPAAPRPEWCPGPRR